MPYYRFDDLLKAATQARQQDLIGNSAHAAHQKRFGKDVKGNGKSARDGRQTGAANGMLIRPPYVPQNQTINGLYREAWVEANELLTADWLYRETIEDERLYYLVQDHHPLKIPLYLPPAIYNVSFELQNSNINWCRRPDEEFCPPCSEQLYNTPDVIGALTYYILRGGQTIWGYFETKGLLINTYQEYTLSEEISTNLTQTDFLINNDYSWKIPYQGNFYLVINTRDTFDEYDCFKRRYDEISTWAQGTNVKTVITSLYDDDYDGKYPNILLTLMPFYYYFDFQIVSYRATTYSFLLNMNARHITHPIIGSPEYTVNFNLEITMI